MDMQEKERILHERFLKLNTDNLTRGEHARLNRIINDLEIMLDRIETGYYNDFKP